jgi:hypothetical protein
MTTVPREILDIQARLEERRRQEGVDVHAERAATTRKRRDGLGATNTDEDSWRQVDAAIDAAAAQERSLPPSFRHTRLPDGCIVSVTLEDVIEKNVSGCDKWWAVFRIMEARGDPEAAAEASGRLILRSWNAPRRGTWLSPRHALAMDYLAVVGRPLQSIPRHPPRAIVGAFLRGVVVEARTHLVTKFMDREARKWAGAPGSEHYSIVDKLLKLEAGTPRVLLRKAPE